MRSKTELVVRTLLPIVAGAGCMITLLTAMTTIAELRNAMPRIGDIVSFAGSQDATSDNDLRLVAQRPAQFGCILDVSVLQRSGGSFVVESQIAQKKGKFRVHWAGERTAADTGNCGNSADLLLEAHDLRILASAAGGYDMSEHRESFYVK